MTVAEYQQAQKDIAEIRGQIAQLRDVVAKGVPAMRGVYGLDQPDKEPLPEAGASYPNVGMLQFQQGKMMAGAELAKTAVTPFSTATEMIRGNPEEQGTIENIARGGAALIATAPAMLPLTIEQSVIGGIERGNPAAPATDMAQAIGQTFQRQVTGEAGGVTRGEAWAKTPVEEAFNLATPLLAGLGISKARTPKFKSIKEARAAINDIGKPKVDVPEVVQEPIRNETPKVEQPTSAAEVVGKAETKPTTDWAYDAKKTSRSKGWTLTPERVAEIEKGFENRRREWIDKERETNPDFAPDIESKKELLTPEQLVEVNRYEELMHKATSLERANGYKPTKLSKTEQAEYSNLGKKYQDIFYSRAGQPTTATEVVAKADVTKSQTPQTITEDLSQGKPKSWEMTKAEQEAVAKGIHPTTLNLLNEAMSSNDLVFQTEKLQSVLRPDNKLSRSIFTERTGVKLPRTRKGTNEAIGNWQVENNLEVRAKVREVISKQYPDKLEAFDAQFSSTNPSTPPPVGDKVTPSGKPTTAEAVVKKAGEKKVTVKQAATEIKQEAKSTVLTDKSFKTQMKSEIESALRDAPDRPQELQDMVDSYNYLDENRRGMDWETAEARLKEKRGEIDDLKNRLGVKTVTIEIPGDGTFKIEHSKQSLLELQKRLGRNIETKVPEVKSTPRGGDRGLQGARINGYDVSVFDDVTIRPSGTKGLSTIKVDYRNDPVAKKLGIVTNGHYLVEESALSKHPKQIQMSDEMLDEKRVSEMLESFDKVKYDENPAKEVVTYNDGLNNKVIFDNGDVFVGFSGEYIEFLKNSVKDFSLKLSGETTPAAIMSGKKRVGVIMPLKSSEQFAITRPHPPTELHAGVNPFKIIDDYMTKRKLVNPLGTPEHVLSGKGIVEPFRKAQESIRNDTKLRGESLQKTLEGIKRGSKEDTDLYHRLDDPKAVLNEQEQAVRNYLDDMLTEVNKHRDERGQEPVKRRKGYITHLVEEVEKQSREYGDTPMPKRFRFQFELAREGNASHKVSAIEALEVYTKAALKDIHIGDALAETVPKIEAMGDRPLIFKKSVTSPDGKVTNMSFYQFSDAPIVTERGYAESFIKGQMNVPTVGQRILDKVFDIKPNTSSHAAMAVTARFYQSLLGLAVDSSVKNLTQGINTMAEMGVLPTLKGYAKLATAKGLKTAKAEHLLEDFNPLLMEGADLPFKTKTARTIGKGFSATMNAPMKVAEFINRGAAYHAAYDVYIKKGMSLEQAHEAARAAVRKTQFSYAKIDTSPALRGPFARTFSQFFSYPLKQSEMMYKWATKPGEQGKLVRYFLYTGMAVVGAKYGGVDLSGVFFDPIRMVDPNSKEGFQLPGTDKRVTFDASKLGKSGYTPQGFAPSISIPADFIKSQMSDDESAREYGRKKALTNIIPGGRYGKKVYDVITESDEKGKRDRLTRENTTKDKVLKLLGGKSTDREAESSRRETVNEVEKKYYATRQKLIDLKISGNEDEFIKLRDEFRDRYPFLYGRLMKGFGDAVKEERKKKGMTTDERFFDNSLRKQIDANL